MKHNIATLEAVRSFYAVRGIKVRIRYYADGKEVAKGDATSFTISGTDVEYVAVAPKAKQAAKERTGTKASVIRDKIKEMLAVEAYDFAEAVDFAVNKLNMKKPLARVYVKNLTAKLV